MKPNIIVVGKSGSGKSTSLRNLNPKSTAILNVERKQLPFKEAKNFLNVAVPDLNTFNAAFKKAMDLPQPTSHLWLPYLLREEFQCGI